jgi:hypothetical protein
MQTAQRINTKTLGISMEYLAFNYFTAGPSDQELSLIAKAVYESDLTITHLGKNDPPRKWKGSEEEFLEIFIKGDDSTNYIFSRAKGHGIEIDFTINHDLEWETSSISISGKEKVYVESLCIHFSKYISSFMCISGQMGLGSNQKWNILLENNNCPISLKEKVNA